MAAFAATIKALLPVAVCLALPGAVFAVENKGVPASQLLPGGKDGAAASKFLAIRPEKKAEIEVSASGTSVRVLRGEAIVRNQLDRSIMRLSAGTGYEVTTHYDAAQRQPVSALSGGGDIIALFETKSNTSFLYALDRTSKIKAEIVAPPSIQSYCIGNVAATKLSMSRMCALHFPPAGVVVWHQATPALADEATPQ